MFNARRSRLAPVCTSTHAWPALPALLPGLLQAGAQGERGATGARDLAGSESFQDFLASATGHIPIVGFLVNLVVAALLATLLGWIYVRYGRSLSNRRLFARNFVVLAMTVMLIISIVKSSLALSLGLVGALSIVRYRAAIKEPEELAYLFIAIAIGLGMGANQGLITVSALAVIVFVLWLRQRLEAVRIAPNLHLTISTTRNGKAPSLDDLIGALEKHCSLVELRRFDETAELLEADFLVEFDDYARLEQGRAELRKLDDSLTIHLLETQSSGGWG